jgi:hypothetical protein
LSVWQKLNDSRMLRVVVCAGRTNGAVPVLIGRAVPVLICRAVPATVCGTLIVFWLKRMSFGSANANPIMPKLGRADLCTEHLPAVQPQNVTGALQKSASIGGANHTAAERAGRTWRSRCLMEGCRDGRTETWRCGRRFAPRNPGRGGVDPDFASRVLAGRRMACAVETRDCVAQLRTLSSAQASH